MDIELLWERAEIIKKTREFFDRRNYLETDTPLLSPDLIPESCLEVFETLRLFPLGSRSERQSYWLIPSPEIWMKKLISRHGVSLYQICKCFRNGESSGFQHSPEFTMLEYYTMDAGYMESLGITEELFSHLLKGRYAEDLSPPFVKITVEEAFRNWAGMDLYKSSSSPALMEEAALALGLAPMKGLSVSTLYDLIFIHKVEPMLKMNKPVVLCDYPAFVPCLAKKSSDGKTVERWELYIRGIELANCFTEECSPVEVKKFFENEKAEKELNALVKHKVDEDYWKIFSEPSSFPPCSGVAMGMDRLIMALCGKSTIDAVLPFPME